MTTNSVTRVLVVDDSAYVRKVVSQILSRSPFMEVVGTARDGQEALDRVVELGPDVVTCDLIMPGADGVDFIRRQMARRPVPIVIVSMAGESSERVLSGLDAGAVDFVQKPTALATEKVFDVADELVAKVVAAARAPLRRAPEAPPAPRPIRVPTTFQNRYSVLVVGVSTGGPQGLKSVIPLLPADFPVPVAIVLHMPVGYTEAYAQRLDEVSAVTVTEARDGQELRPGVVLVAQAGRHLTFQRDGSRTMTRLDLRPLDTPHRPSVDVMFQSAADVFGERVLGVVMTGMGNDGLEGAGWIKARGGAILTEAEETCVVYGMPRAVAEAGLSDEAVPLDRLTMAILERV